MANKKNAADNLIKVTIGLSADEEKFFNDYIARNKFKTPRLALVHLLTVAAKEEGIELKNEDSGTGAAEKDKPKEDDGKKARGRPKGGKKEVVVASPQAGDIVPESDSENDDMAGQQKGQTTKRQPKKTVPRSKKPSGERRRSASAEPVQMDETFHVKEQAKVEPPKKAGKGKKPLAEEVEAKNKGDDHDGDAAMEDVVQSPKTKTGAGETTKSKSPGKKTDAEDVKSPKAKADAGEVPEAKKRRGKVAGTATMPAEVEQQEPVVAVSGRGGTLGGKGMKKTTSVSAVTETMHELAVEHPDEPAAAGGDGKGRGGGKRKKANEKKDGGAATTSASQPELGGAVASTKPKRGRGVPKKDYTEKLDDSDD